MKSLSRAEHRLSDPRAQKDLLDGSNSPLAPLPRFQDLLDRQGIGPLTASRFETLQMNVGRLCNQACKHCHVDAGPDRTELMSRKIFEACLRMVDRDSPSTVDLTGGAPEMNPHFRWFVEELSKRSVKILVRCNLTIILASDYYGELPEFFARNRVEVVSSLPFYQAERTDRQRGTGVFEKSIEALRRLNAVGYGRAGTGLVLNLVYNPAGAFFPAPQDQLERDFRKSLDEGHQVAFNNLFALTNLPINRFLDYLLVSGNYETYMEKLVEAFNPVAASGAMCRSMVSVSWDGRLYDCDFNQVLDLPAQPTVADRVESFDRGAWEHRIISTGRHCFGCTAGAGSSCGGATT
ncbi:MAG: arsenosugar biosynthesis radical SAM protein ArsS [Spirochaetes bacterium]|nr:arsenosugar biosynthesis radical SAM protein ArsS [Spirochaetota bacterium]